MKRNKQKSRTARRKNTDHGQSRYAQKRRAALETPTPSAETQQLFTSRYSWGRKSKAAMSKPGVNQNEYN